MNYKLILTTLKKLFGKVSLLKEDTTNSEGTEKLALLKRISFQNIKKALSVQF